MAWAGNTRAGRDRVWGSVSARSLSSAGRVPAVCRSRACSACGGLLAVLAGHAVAVAVEVRQVAGLARGERCGTGRADRVAVPVEDRPGAVAAVAAPVAPVAVALLLFLLLLRELVLLLLQGLLALLELGLALAERLLAGGHLVPLRLEASLLGLDVRELLVDACLGGAGVRDRLVGVGLLACGHDDTDDDAERERGDADGDHEPGPGTARAGLAVRAPSRRRCDGGHRAAGPLPPGRPVGVVVG